VDGISHRTERDARKEMVSAQLQIWALSSAESRLGLRWAIKWAFIKLCLFYVVVKERTDIHLPFKLKVRDQNRRWFLSNFAVVRR
jgi:hypothetical protein